MLRKDTFVLSTERTKLNYKMQRKSFTCVRYTEQGNFTRKRESTKTKNAKITKYFLVDNYRVFAILSFSSPSSYFRVFVIVLSCFRLRVFAFSSSCFRVLKLLNKNAMALTEHRINQIYCFTR